MSFKPGYAMTVHKSQSLTIRENYSIYEYEDMRPKMLYTSMTRATKKEHVNFCKIDNYKPHTVMNTMVHITLVQQKNYLNGSNNMKKE